MALAAMSAAGAMAFPPGSGPPGLRALERDFVCPETLPNDAARFAAMQRFMARYEAIAPRSTIPERLALHDRLLAKHGCAEPTEQYTFPQS